MRVLFLFLIVVSILFGGEGVKLTLTTPPCQNLQEGLLLTTYDISGYSKHYPGTHEDFIDLEQSFAKPQYLFGRGEVENIDTTGGNHNPFQDNPDEHYLSIFKGYIYIPQKGTYTFAVNGDDAVEVSFNDDQIYYGWYGGHGRDGTDHNFDVTFTKEGYYKIKFRHQEWSGGDNYQLYWKKPGESDFSIVPKSNLFHCPIPRPIAEWRMDECGWSGENGEIYDYSGHGLDGRSVNGATQELNVTAGGGLCKVGKFDGDKKQYLIIPNNVLLNPDDKNFTISVWVKKGRHGGIVYNKENLYELKIGNDNTICYAWKPYWQWTCTQKIDPKRWNHIVLTYDHVFQRVYLNGKQIYEWAQTGDIGSNTSDLRIAARRDYGGNHFDGYIDEMKIYDRALDAERIEELYEFELNKRNYDGTKRICQLCPVKPTCWLTEGIDFATYDISDYAQRYPRNHTDYDLLEQSYAIPDKKYGEQIIPNINTVGGNNNPFQKDPDEHYLSIFKGYIYIPQKGTYSFAVNGDDAVEVNFGNEEIYYGWYGGHGRNGTSHNFILTFTKVGFYPIKFRHQEWSAGDSYQLFWKRPGEVSFTIVPKSSLRACLKIKSFYFDIWDEKGSLTDRPITTKIVSQEFNLTLREIDRNDTYHDDFNGTVCCAIFDLNSSQRVSDWNATIWRAQDDINQTLVTFNVLKAVKKAKVYIYWLADTTISQCGGLFLHEQNETNSTDDFAIRPDRFELTLPSKAYAEENFTISLYAEDGDGESAKDYNETFADSFTIHAKDTKPGCKSGHLSTQSFAFEDGKKEHLQVNYDDIGDINITIHEIEKKEFAKVDADDTPLDERLITPASAIIKVDPYEANVTDVQWSVAGGGNWLYMVKDKKLDEMNVTLSATIALFGKKGTKLTDFNSSCYAKDVEVQALYDMDNADGGNVGLVTKGAMVEDGKISGIDKKILFLSDGFVNGEQTRSYAFNIDANYSTPIAPIYIKLQDVTINSPVAKVLNSAVTTGKLLPDRNATFYYARLLPQDLLTTKQTESTSARIVVFDKGSPYTAGFEQTLLNWYLNAKHLSAFKGSIKQIRPKKDVTLSSTDSDTGASSLLANGIFRIDLTKGSDQKAYIHLDIPSWLWYSSVGSSYSFAPSSSCTEHPCIIYTFTNNILNKVQSGDISGVHYDLNISTKKKGVKVFR